MRDRIESKETMTMALRIAMMVAALALVSAVMAASASAKAEISEFVINSSNQQAGAHPDLSARMKLTNAGAPEVAKDLTANFPTGVFGNPGAIFRCSAADFVINHCSPGSQAGLVTVISNYEGNPNFVLGTAPIYNMETLSEEETARLAFVAPTVNLPITMPIAVRSESDYGLRMVIQTVSQTIALSEASMTVWGFPASSEHDSERFSLGSPGSPQGCPGLLTSACNAAPFPKAGVFNKPFIDNPSICTGASLPVTLDVTTYQDPAPAHAESAYNQTTNCEAQKFDPVLNIGLTSSEADSPSGLDIQLKAEQFLEGEAPAQSALRSASLTLPEGLTINPDAADGQSACSDAQAGFGSKNAGDCPDNSKIGTVEVTTPALDGPLKGSLYIGEPRPDNQYRVFMIFDGFGIHAKLAAEFHPDPVTGQLTMTVDDIPQVPFEVFNLHLFASDRGLVATPTFCRIYTGSSELTPWNASLAPQNSAPLVSISSGSNGSSCPGQVRPFHPRLVAGTSNPIGGDFSAFTLRLDRDDGDQFLGDLTFKMPPGFTGNLRGIDYCPEASILGAAQRLGREEQLVPSCSASSQIGTTNVAAGPGEHPFHAVGKMYLSGPFKGAPLSLAAITPALAGPYDYGVVVVRVALQVDPLTAQVKALSDKVPSIIGGIPIRMRSIQVNIDRPNFTINPTNCSPFTVDSQGIGDQGTVTDFSSSFQAVNCRRLAFKPRMSIRQIGSRKATRRATNPALRFDLWTRDGDANVRSLAVTLSKAFAIDQRHLSNLCSERELAERQCAGRTPIGTAWTKTPLLDQRLAGPVFAVSGSGGLPRLAFILNGQVSLVPRADAKTVGGGKLMTTVPVVPDAPIGHFQFEVFGGKSGYLINTRDICQTRPAVMIDYLGQNGKSHKQNVKIKTKCGTKKSKRVKRQPRR